MTNLNPDFWEKHFTEGHTPWDRGLCSPQLLQWLDTGALKPCRIAVPGCGNAWEVATLASRGFQTVGIDYTPAAVHAARSHLAQRNLTAEIVQADVLSYTPEQCFEAIYEQTCLCALNPDHWVCYSQQLARWLRPGGFLYVLFMQVERPGAAKGLVQGPPFHCDINAMHALFNSASWIWPDEAPAVVAHPNGLNEFAIRLQRK